MAGEQGFVTNNRELTIVDIQEGGTGANGWKILDADAELDAPSGNRPSFESDWGRSEIGSSLYFGQHATNNPSTVSSNLKARIRTLYWLRGILLQQGQRWDGLRTSQKQINLRVRYRVGNIQDLTNFGEILYLYDVYNTSDSFSTMVADSMTGVSDKFQETAAIQAGFMFRQAPMLHRDISSATLTTAQNKILWLYGDTFITASDSASVGVSPGLTGITTDNGQTWVQDVITPFANGHTTDLTQSGKYIVYAGSLDGCAYIDIDDLLTGSGTFTASTGISTNFPTFVDTCPSGRVWAVGNGGRVWRSDDNGITFTEQGFSNSTTTENITSIHAVQDNKVFCGLANGEILVISGLENPTASLIGTATTGTTDQIDAIIAGTHPSLSNLIIGTDAGTIFKTNNRNATTPTFTQATFPNTGIGAIKAFTWGSLYCESLYIVQDNASPVGQVLRDLSGGALGAGQVETPNGNSAFTPTNAGINDIAIAFNNQGTSTCSGLTAGNLVSAVAWIGEVTSESS